MASVRNHAKRSRSNQAASSSPRAAGFMGSAIRAPIPCGSSLSSITPCERPPVNIVHSDVVVTVPPGRTPTYRSANPLLKLLSLLEHVQLAASREHYFMDQV